jgi:hypothetical protein
MDARALREFLDELKSHGHAQGHFLGLLHILIGRRITHKDIVVSQGMTWRELAAWLKKMRWDRESAREAGLKPEEMPPRDRERYWYVVISRAGVDSPAALADAAKLAQKLGALDYVIGPPPGTSTP